MRFAARLAIVALVIPAYGVFGGTAFAEDLPAAPPPTAVENGSAFAQVVLAEALPNAAANPPAPAARDDSSADKVTVCRPTGNDTNPYSLITIGAPARQATDITPVAGTCPVPPAPPAAPAIDLCSNLPGVQATVPVGRFRTDGRCLLPTKVTAAGPSTVSVGPATRSTPQTLGQQNGLEGSGPLVTVVAGKRRFSPANSVRSASASLSATQLPRTGSQSQQQAAAGLLMVMSGAGLVLLGGRRPTLPA